MDTESAGQFMISIPFVSCTIAGAIFSNITLGLSIGVLLQLPFLIEIPAGGAKLSQINLAAYVATALACVFKANLDINMNAVMIITIIYALILSWGTRPFSDLLHRVNKWLVSLAERAAENHKFKLLDFFQYSGAGISFIYGLIYSAMFFIFGKLILGWTFLLIPEPFYSSLHFVKYVLMGAGIGAMVWFFINQKNKIKFCLIGLILTIILKMFSM